MSNSSALKYLVFSLLFFLAAIAAWRYFQAENAKALADPVRARQEGRPVPVRTAVVTAKQTEQVIGGTAVTTASEVGVIQIAPLRSRALEHLADVIVKRVYCRSGDFVRQGQLLFEIDGSVLRQVLRQRQAELSAAEANVKLRAEGVRYQEERVQMMSELVKDRVVAKSELLEYQSQLAAARSLLVEAELRLETVRVEYEVAQRDLLQFQIQSPLTGIIDEVRVVAGTTVAVPTVLGTVYRLNPIHVVMDFPQERLNELRTGLPAEVVLDSFPNETFSGTVIRALPQVNTELRVVPVLVEVPNPRYRVKAGISGYVRLQAARGQAVVPTSAVVEHGDRAMVFVVEKERAYIREVLLGPIVEVGLREVSSGLSEGEEVVIFHNFARRAGRLTLEDCYLQDGDEVDANWRKWSRRE